MNINDVVALIPEDTTGRDEALFAIESITTYPASNAARLRVHPMNEFRLWLKLEGGAVSIEAEGRPARRCQPTSLVGVLRREICAIDEAISAGKCRQTPPREALIVDAPAPPASMDLPVWDQSAQSWRDAEY